MFIVFLALVLIRILSNCVSYPWDERQNGEGGGWVRNYVSLLDFASDELERKRPTFLSYKIIFYLKEIFSILSHTHVPIPTEIQSSIYWQIADVQFCFCYGFLSECVANEGERVILTQTTHTPRSCQLLSLLTSETIGHIFLSKEFLIIIILCMYCSSGHKYPFCVETVLEEDSFSFQKKKVGGTGETTFYLPFSHQPNTRSLQNILFIRSQEIVTEVGQDF